METQLADVGRRIRESMGTRTQRALADAADITPDALSRALNGARGFSLSEITRIAQVLSVDVAWLITGAPDPHRVEFAARHAWDADTRQRSNPREADDAPLLDSIVDLYRAAFPNAAPSSRPLPGSAAEVRAALGDDFVGRFAQIVEQELDVDIVRIADLSTAYSLRLGGRGIIVLNTTPNWFYSNWSLAHELGHLALGHHDESDGRQKGEATLDQHEREANAFAADLLLPEDLMRAQPWATMTLDQLSAFLWATGVSTKPLRYRIQNLRITVADEVASAMESSTFDVLRSAAAQLQPPLTNSRAVAERRQQATAIRYPLALVEALTTQVERGAADPRMLASVLTISVDEVFDTFDIPEEETDEETAARLVNSHAQLPTTSALSDWIAQHERS